MEFKQCFLTSSPTLYNQSQESRCSSEHNKVNTQAIAMAGGEEVKLLGSWSSPFVMRVRIALKLKGVSYDFAEEALLDGKSELLIKNNPVYKKIPVLIHNGNSICESMIIVQYIDEVWCSGTAILPADSSERADARFWAFYIDDKLFRAIFGVGMGRTEAARAEAAEQLCAGLQLLEEAFSKCSKGKGFFGDTIGYIDIVLGSNLAWLRVMERLSGIGFLDGGKTPLLAAWASRFCSHIVVKELMPEIERLNEYNQLVMAKYKVGPYSQ